MSTEQDRIRELEAEIEMLRETLRDIYSEVVYGAGTDTPARIIELDHWDIAEEVIDAYTHQG